MGGKRENVRMDPEAKLSMWSFDFVLNAWTEYKWTPAQKAWPLERWGHSVVTCDQGVFLHGGCNAVAPFYDCWLLTLLNPTSLTAQWIRLPSTQQDIDVRAFASAVGHKSPLAAGDGADSLVLFGGQYHDGQALQYIDELLVVRPHVEPASVEVSQPAWSGTSPGARAQHAAATTSALGGRHMVLIGGCDASTIFADVFTLCMDSWVWSSVKMRGPPPVIPMNKGPQPDDPDRPVRRISLRCVSNSRVLSTPVRAGVLVMGEDCSGCSTTTLLELVPGRAEQVWQRVKLLGASAVVRRDSALVRWQRQLFSIGGTSGRRFHYEARCVTQVLRVQPGLLWPNLRLLLIGRLDDQSNLSRLSRSLLKIVISFLRQEHDYDEVDVF